MDAGRSFTVAIEQVFMSIGQELLVFDTIIPKVWNLEGVLLAVMFTFYLSCLYIMLWAIWYHLYNFENVKNTHRGVLLLCFSRFSNCINGTKLRKVSHICFMYSFCTDCCLVIFKYHEYHK